MKTSTQNGGEVKRLSVAVVVDGAGDGTAYKPRSAAEMAQITSLVKSAMGFDTSRGDQVQVTNMEFARVDAGDATPAPKPLLGLDSAYWFKIIEAAIMCVTALLIGLFVARPLIARMFAPNGPSFGTVSDRRFRALRRRPAGAVRRTPGNGAQPPFPHPAPAST